MKWALTFFMTVTLGFSHLAMAEERLLVVEGVAERTLEPNLVRMNVEIWSRASTAKQAQQLAANQYKVTKKSFDEFKLKKEDIQTENYSLNPEYEYDQKLRQNKLMGYKVVQSLTVTLRKIEDAGNFLDALIGDRKDNNSGVNVNSIAWDSDKKSQAEASALADAVKTARSKADEMAKAAGVRIKAVNKITYAGQSSGPQPVVRNFGMMKASMDSAPTELAEGQVKVRVEVNAQFEIN